MNDVAGDLVDPMRNPPHPGELIRESMDDAGWNVTGTAVRLGCEHGTLSRLPPALDQARRTPAAGQPNTPEHKTDRTWTIISRGRTGAAAQIFRLHDGRAPGYSSAQPLRRVYFGLDFLP